jgi:hypothetical protein
LEADDGPHDVGMAMAGIVAGDPGGEIGETFAVHIPEFGILNAKQPACISKAEPDFVVRLYLRGGGGLRRHADAAVLAPDELCGVHRLDHVHLNGEAWCGLVRMHEQILGANAGDHLAAMITLSRHPMPHHGRTSVPM